MFPLVNSGILLSSSSFPHGQPKPVLPCVVCHSCHSVTLSQTRSSFNLSPEQSTATPMSEAGALLAKHSRLLHPKLRPRSPGFRTFAVFKKQFNDTGRWEVVGSSMSCQCLRKFVSSLGDQPESVKKVANWASVIRWRSVYKSAT